MRDRDDDPANVMEGLDGLAARLRAAAAAERPPFAPELHARLVARIVPGRSRTARVRRLALPALAGGLVAAAVLVMVVSPATTRPPADEPAAAAASSPVDSAPGIERLPTLAEVEEGVVASVTAALVDLPPWFDLVAVDSADFGADEAGR